MVSGQVKSAGRSLCPMSRLYSVLQLTPSVLPDSWVWTLCSSVSPENKSPVGWGWAVAWHTVLMQLARIMVWPSGILKTPQVIPMFSQGWTLTQPKSNKCQTNVSYLHSIFLNNYLLIIFLQELSISLKCYFKSKCPFISGNEKQLYHLSRPF